MFCPIDDECVVAKECALYCNALIQLSDFAKHNEAVIQELEQLITDYADGEDDYRDGIKLGIKKAIVIIRGDKKGVI